MLLSERSTANLQADEGSIILTKELIETRLHLGLEPRETLEHTSVDAWVQCFGVRVSGFEALVGSRLINT